MATVYDPAFALSADKKSYIAVNNNTPYQAASKRRVPPPALPPLRPATSTSTQ